MNYTKPNDLDHEDTPKEWLNSALIFAGALSNLLSDRTGVVIDINGDEYNPVGNSKKVIVCKYDNMIHIENFEQDLPAGSICEILN